MRYSNYSITLDIQAAGSGVVLSAKRGDTGRKLFATLTDGGRPYCVTEDCYAVFTAVKPDGHILFNECTLDAGTLCYVLREQLLIVPGQVKCELRLYGTEAMLLTSASFTILVEDTVYSDGDEIESTDDFSALTALITQTLTLRDELLKLKNELEGGSGSGGGSGVIFTPHVDKSGDLSWTNNGGLDNPDTVNIKGPQGAQGPAGAAGEDGADGYTPQKGTDYFTEADQQQIVDEVLEKVPEHTETIKQVAEALPRVSAVDFSNFENGSFAETVDGEEVNYAVTLDDSGRPVSVGDVFIQWE